MSSTVLKTFRCLSQSRTMHHGVLKSISASPMTTVRCFVSTPTLSSGHSRWSKIKHDKGKADARRGASYSLISQEISCAARDGGADSSNLRLNAAISAAKKAGMPKERINGAVQRGLGKSSSGAALEQVIVEAVGPGAVGMIVECQTDKKLRALQEVKAIINKLNGQSTPTMYLFSQKGIIRVLAGSGGHELDQIMDTALEIEGTEDVDEAAIEDCEEGKPEIIITTEFQKTRGVVSGLKENLPGIQILSYNVEFVANEDTRISVSDMEPKTQAFLSEFIERLQELPDVSEVYTNTK